MSKTTTTSFFSWRGAFQIALAVAAFFMVDPYIRKLLSFVQEHCIAELSPHWFGAFVCLLVVCCFYILLGRYRNTYIPIQLRCGLLLLAAAYLYYRVSPCCYYRLSPEFYFWRIPLGDWAVFRATWTDLLFLPWLYVMGGRGILRYLSSNRRCMRMLRVLWFWKVWPNRLCKLQAEVGHQEKQATSSNISAPIEHAEDDELDFNPKVSELAKELRGLDLKERSTCYGIIAPWGYGKTSFLNLLSNELSADGIVVTFNPRSAKSVEHIQEDFFAKLAQELSQYYWGAGLIVSRYAEQIGILNHYSTVRLIADASRLFLSKGSKASVSNAIEKIGKRLYIVLDDLDRLEGKELLETIKLIDITASFKNTVFLVACDKKYANDVLQEYLGANPGQGYLDKYITREIDLLGYINEKLTVMMARYLQAQITDGILVSKKEVLQEWHGIANYIIPHLGTCRELKRYFNLFISDFREVQDFVDPADFFILTLLKYKDKGVYDVLKYRVRFWEDGEPFVNLRPENWYYRKCSYSEVNSLDPERRAYPQGSSEQLRSILQGAHWQGATVLLWLLFPNSKMMKGVQLPPAAIAGYGRTYRVPYSSIRNSNSFSSYFPDLGDIDRDLWHKDVLSLRKSRDREAVQKILDRRYPEDRDAVISLLGDLALFEFYRDDDRAITIMHITYLADKYNDLELRKLLIELLTDGRLYAYEMIRMIIGSGEYKRLMNRVFACMLSDQPLLACEVLSVIGDPSKQNKEYIYGQKEAAVLILQALESCLEKYYDYEVGRLGEVINGLLKKDSCFIFKEEAFCLVVDWIRKHPADSIWPLLSISQENSKLKIWFRSCVDTMIDRGLSMDNWMSSIEDPESKAIFQVITSSEDGFVECSLTESYSGQMFSSYLYDAFVHEGLI